MWTGVPLSVRISKNTWARYVGALAATLTALSACRALNPFVADFVLYILLFLFPAVAFAAWYCGVGPSILAVVLAVVGVKYWFIPPVHSLHIPNTAHAIGILAFLFGSGVVVAMGEARRRENEKLRQGQEKLEERVQQRTAELDTASQGLRQLTARLLELQDDERRRFARELHDSVGQNLAALAMNLSAARNDIERLAKTAGTLADSEELVQEMSKEVRTISHLLHPPLLDEAGLKSALPWYVQGFAERSKIQVDLEFPHDFGRLSRELETAVFRLVQECLTNIHRHSGSPIAKIRLTRSDSVVCVIVEDKGKGITAEKLIEMDSAGMPGVGIRGMRERIRQLGGSLEINSEGSGKGTVILVQLPVASSSSTAAA